MTTDPDGDAMQYTFDWGDVNTSTNHLMNSGVTASVSYAWTSQWLVRQVWQERTEGGDSQLCLEHACRFQPFVHAMWRPHIPVSEY